MSYSKYYKKQVNCNKFWKWQVGNAVTDMNYDALGTVTYWWTHAMISDTTYNSILTHCNFTSDKTSKPCDKVIYYAMNHEFGNVDQYSIYTPKCPIVVPNNTVSPARGAAIRFKNSLLRRRVSGYDPCTENYAEKYYNLKEVQMAMHANVTGIPYKWTACRWVFASFLCYLAKSYNITLPPNKVLLFFFGWQRHST